MTSDQETHLRRQIGSRLAEARMRAGYATQREAREALGLGNTDIVGMWERGEAMPKHDSLIALCRLYRVSSDWVLGLSESLQIGGSGALMDLAVERAILGGSNMQDVAAQVRKLGRTLGDYILFGYEVPREYELLTPDEWELRRQAVLSKLRKLAKGTNDPGPSTDRRSGKRG